MTQNEVCTILDDILIENDFWFSEISDCRDDNAETISNLNDIFKAEKPYDFTLLAAAIKLLCKDSESLIDYFKEDNSNLDFDYPSRTDLMIVTIGFLDSPLFFSKCWNMVAMIESEMARFELAEEDDSKDRIIAIALFLKMSDLLIKRTVYFNYFVRASAAGTPGFNNITRIPINYLGELEIRGNSEAKRIVFVLFLNPENKGMKFELKINCEIANESYDAIIRKETSEESDEVRSMLIHADFSKGIHIKGIEWNPL